jgi:hypothetical protein
MTVDGRGPYGAIYRKSWERQDFRMLSYDARALLCYLRTCPAGSLIGIFRFHPDFAHADLGIPADRIEPALRELEESGFIQRHELWLWIVDAVAATPNVSLQNEKHRIAVVKALQQVDDVLAQKFRRNHSFTDTQSIPNDNDYPNHVDVEADVDGSEDEDSAMNEK